MSGILGFIFIGFLLFRKPTNLNLTKIAERFIILFPISFYFSLGKFNLNSTEFYGLIIGLLYILQRKTVSLQSVKIQIFYFGLFVFLVIISLKINNDLASNILVIVRYLIYFLLIILMKNLLWNKIFERAILKSYKIILFTSSLEVIYRLFIDAGKLSSVSSISWKLKLFQLGLYPQTINYELIQSWSGAGGIVSLFPNHHAYALYLSIITILIALNLVQLSTRKKITFLAVNIILLYLSQSRGVLIITILTLLYFYRSHFNIKILIKIAAFGIVIFYFSIEGLFTRIISLGQTFLDIFNLVSANGYSGLSYLLYNSISTFSDYSTIARFLYNMNSINLIIKNPFFGSGDYGFEISDKLLRANPHNLYLQIAQKYGVFALFLFIKFIITSVTVQTRRVRMNFIVYILAISAVINPISDLRTCFLLILFLVISPEKIQH